MNSNQITDSLLATIETLAKQAVSNVKYDKTIIGNILKCKDATIGHYTVQYQDSIIEAYAADASVTYSKGSTVYVQIPQGFKYFIV